MNVRSLYVDPMHICRPSLSSLDNQGSACTVDVKLSRACRQLIFTRTFPITFPRARRWPRELRLTIEPGEITVFRLAASELLTSCTYKYCCRNLRWFLIRQESYVCTVGHESIKWTLRKLFLLAKILRDLDLCLTYILKLILIQLWNIIFECLVRNNWILNECLKGAFLAAE